MPEEISLRVVLVDPPAGFAFCLQRGKGAKSERLDYLEADGGELNFDLAVAVREGKLKGTPDFAGPFVQGPPGGRFFYLCVGQCAPTVEPHWSGRVKVPLSSITWGDVRQALDGSGVLHARYAASCGNGQPALASVPLLGDGWAPG